MNRINFLLKKKPTRLSCFSFMYSCILSCSVASNSFQPPGLQHARLLCPWDCPGKNTGVGCHALLQGIFPTQGLNPGQILYHVSHQGSPFLHVKTQQKDWNLWTRKEAVTKHCICQHLDLGLPSLQNCENKFLLFYKPPHLRGSLIVMQTKMLSVWEKHKFYLVLYIMLQAIFISITSSHFIDIFILFWCDIASLSTWFQ